MRWQLGVYFLTLSFILVVTAKVPAGEPTFTTIDPPGAIFSEANDINPSGEIVGRYYDGVACSILNACTNVDGHNHGYLLSEGEFTTIDPPGSIFTGAVGINPRGDIVGQYTSVDGKIHGYLLSGGEFASIDFPGAILTNAWKINPAGDIVGRYRSADGMSHAYLLSGGEFTSIDFPIAFETAPFAFIGINARGDVVSHFCDAPPCTPASNGKVHGFLLREGEFTPFDFPGAFGTIASAINARGDIVGLYKDTATTPTCTISPRCGQGHSYLRTR